MIIDLTSMSDVVHTAYGCLAIACVAIGIIILCIAERFGER